MGIKVKCIDNDNLIEPRGGKLLTIGEEYEILDIETDSKSRIYWIIDNTNTRRFYDSWRFWPSLEELREIKINQLI